MEKLIIKGARAHNLKNINLELPKNKLIVFTGISGSGKSSLAFDTIYAEGQRRYVQSLSSYARQFLGVMDKPDVDSIEGLSPSISIDQKSTSHNPRSTVGTVTEIYDYLRLLFARIGHPHCPNCGQEIAKQSAQQIVEGIMKLATQETKIKSGQPFRFLILAPVVRDRKGEFSGLFGNLRAKGYRKARIDKHIVNLDSDMFLIKTNKHNIDVVIDALTVDSKSLKKPDLSSTFRSRVADGVEQALGLSEGLVIVGEVNDKGFTLPNSPKQIEDHTFSERFACPVCNISLGEIEPRSFSFNSPHGACPECTGLGSILTVDPDRVFSPELSITEGGILPFAKMFFHDTWFARVISFVARDYGIDPRRPIKYLTDKQRGILLYGTGDKVHRIAGKNRFGRVTSIEEPFFGIINELKRRYQESESDFVRLEIAKYMKEEICSLCKGKRLKKESLTVTVDELSIADIADLSIKDNAEWIASLGGKIAANSSEATIAAPIIKEVQSRLGFLNAVGLDYLTLGRSATTLAGGEAQRIRLASQIGSGLSGVLYVLDEPSIGLHQRDNTKLINTLKRLRDLGNTVIVVEHDREMMANADYIVDFGPGAGEHGGAIIAAGNLDDIKANHKSETGQFLLGSRDITRKKEPNLIVSKNFLTIKGASSYNLKSINASFPLGKFICITGLSGSGKSTLIVETLYPALTQQFNPLSKERAGKFTKITGIEYIDKAILIDQSPIGRTPRSNPATYTGLFTIIREIFSELPEARLRGYKAGRFSFNVKGGRCEACEGDGQKKIEMQFLSDVYVTCEVCHGTRYNSETLEVTYHGKNIAQVLDMTVEEALEFFAHYPMLSAKLQTLSEVGLGYMHLGQMAPTLSGGEAQRVKLATELSRRATGKTVYILDEPTTGLHFSDLEKLLNILIRLTISGNTVIVIEHNLDIIKNADWIIDLGPKGGEEGGKIIAVGPPGEVVKIKQSYTGQYLRKIIK